jgi:ceramide glucosyltransferase
MVAVGILVLLILGSIFFYCAGAIVTWIFFNSSKGTQRIPDPQISEQSVSILVPVKGLDVSAWQNWSSLCQQDYPHYQVLFGVMQADDPAVPMLQELVREYPDRAQLFVGLLPSRGPNHKDSNVSYLLEKTTADWIIFVDSDIYVTPDYLRRVTAPLADERVGMVTCSYIARNPKFVGAALASLARCCDFTPSVLIARTIDGGVKLGIGPTMVVTREALLKAGGIVCNRIGSDYNLGKRIAEAGYQVELSDYVLESDTGRESIAELYRRELRWNRTIRFNRGAIYYGQVFCFGLVYCLLLLIVTGFASWAIGLTLLTVLVRYGQATISTVGMNAPRLRRWFWLLPLRDLLSFVVWVAGGYGRTIYWRGRKLRIQTDGIITDL